MSPPYEQIEAPFAKTERTDSARFHSGHHPALQSRQHLVGIYEDAVCRLCGEEAESAKHLCLRCLALLVERHLSDLGQTMDVLAASHVQLLRFCGSSSGACGNVNNNNNNVDSLTHKSLPDVSRLIIDYSNG